MGGWISYDSNNSGGSFWLKDEDWKALEEGGWHVGWIYASEKTYDGMTYTTAESGNRYGDTWEKATAPFEVGKPRWDDGDEIVIASASTYDEAVALRAKYGGYFGCLAVSANKCGDSASELVAEFERLTGQDASAEGCNCCGAPHSFEWHDDDGSTSYGNVQVTKTELVWS